MVDQNLLARSEYLVAENRILKAQLKGRSHRAPDCRTFPTISFRSGAAYACRPATSGLGAKFATSSLIITARGDDI
jgi:hypothetical protein